MSIIQESQGLGDVVQSENAVRRRPKPVQLMEDITKGTFKGLV